MFDTEARQIAGLFGVQASMLLYGAQAANQLQHAVDSRDVIGQAKGILMERYAVDEGQAFRVLTRVSQSTHRKLHDVAEELARTRELPDSHA